MRQMISGVVAALAVIVAGAAPAKACDGGCSPCGYVAPCGPTYVQPYAAYERLPDPYVQYRSAPAAVLPQYYYVDQGPTYTGPGNFAPYPAYREGGVRAWDGYRPHRRYHPHYGYRYGYGAPHHYGYRGHVLRRYY